MKLIGVMFVLVSAWSVGHRFSVAMRSRCECVKEAIDALQILRNELAFMGAPLSEAFRAVASSLRSLWGQVFEDMAVQMENDRWLTPATAAKKALASVADEPIGRIMEDLVGKLGSYDLEAQLRCIDCAADEASALLSDLVEEKKLRSKTYKTLSICAGAAIAILLI